MGHIKKFHDFFSAAASNMNEENDDKDLLRDLERVGMKEQTYTREMFQDAMENVNFHEFFDAYPEQSFNFEISGTSSDSADIEARFSGGISGTWDERGLWQAISSEVSSLDVDDYDEDDGEERYELGDLEAAFDSFSWTRNAEGNTADMYDEVEVNMDGRETGTGEYSINAEAGLENVTVDDYVDQDDIIRDILDNL